jgi:hypothetical protein
VVYIWKCDLCGGREENFRNAEPPICDGQPMRRDWRGEGVGFGVASLKKDREGNGTRAIRDRFLPTTKDFAGPSDPDGEKGMHGWLDEHVPKDSNKRPMYPDHSKSIF